MGCALPLDSGDLVVLVVLLLLYRGHDLLEDHLGNALNIQFGSSQTLDPQPTWRICRCPHGRAGCWLSFLYCATQALVRTACSLWQRRFSFRDPAPMG
ncbi:hypothetical protein EFY87_14265 [Flexivirga caeni]|uniref:Uncharacterized protein n=1 Tax=Flexivirga caeni TaxID=2294115 RepID=A0A3M9M5A4_9MICO|nr:hypothetical protein EFY87_14265 [Flexivirga caeni]